MSILSKNPESKSRFAGLAGETFDLIVIGGGIVGCCVARDAALRGLKVALFEKEDFGSGTTARSTRLIHGGLRYLELFDFGLVRQDLREREILLKIAPHRVRPLPFLVPFYDRSVWYRFRLKLGMALYDLLSYDKCLPNHRFLNVNEVLEREPELMRVGLQGAALYWDAQAQLVERLCLDNAIDAAENGASLFNHVAVNGLIREANDRVVGVRLRDTLTGEDGEARGDRVIDVAGPWLDRFESSLTDRPARSLRLTKGVHFAAPPCAKSALVLFSGADNRLFFVVPWLDYVWVGTTDTDFDGDLDAVHAEADDVDYLLDTVRRLVPGGDWDRIHYTNAGVRALVRESRADASESGVSRKHRIIVHVNDSLDGVISILGGKITAARDIAREAVNTFCKLKRAAGDNRPQLRTPCVTGTRPLPGAGENMETIAATARREAGELKLGVEQANHLVQTYGARYSRVLDLIRTRSELGERIAPGYPHVRAEIAYSIENEMALTVSDFMMRRSMLFFTPDQGLAAVDTVADEMSEQLGWSDGERTANVDRYLAQVELTQRFRRKDGHESNPSSLRRTNNGAPAQATALPDYRSPS